MSANTLSPRQFVGNGYYRDVVMSDEGDTVIKTAIYGEGRECNANEVKTFKNLGDKVWKFRFGGKKYKVRLAKIISSHSDLLPWWVEMEYVPGVGNVAKELPNLVCRGCSLDGVSCDWSDCFTCTFYDWCESELGILDIHINNFGLNRARKEIVLIDYGGEGLEV